MEFTFSDEEMELLSNMFFNIEEESNHSPHCVGLSYGTSSSFLPFSETNMNVFPPFVEESLLFSPNHFSQGVFCHETNSNYLPIQNCDQNCFLSTDDFNSNRNQYLKSVDPYSMTYPNDNALLEPFFSNVDDMHETSGSIEKVAIANEQEPTDEPSLKTKIDNVNESRPHNSCSPKKKSNISNKVNAKKRKENTLITRKKKQKMIDSSGHSSEDDDSNGGSSSECKEPLCIPTSKIKTRARRGAATDPQSLYARKRRERINERLKVLQNIVPNGTKVDISTMLEEAVHYVKFLQLQIKLLSSDELWMFAPIAYNGMDVIGLDKRLAQTFNFST